MSDRETVKTGDRFPIQVTANTDLTGATLRLLARTRQMEDPIVLPHAATDPVNGVVEHVLDGSLDLTGTRDVTYMIELEATRGGEVVTFPRDTFLYLTVTRDLDHP